jgi:Flp pilus assembly protein CpaB
MRRSLYFVLFLVLSSVAGLFYYSNTRQGTALVASRDLTVGTRIEDSDIRVRQVNPASIDSQVLTMADQAVGKIVAVPILAGQFLDERQVAGTRNSTLLGAGLGMPSGYRIIGIPIAPAAAVGGVLRPGDRVDVMSIAGTAKAAASLDPGGGTPVMIGMNVLVIGLRTEQGTPVEQADQGLAASGSKAASVLLAIPQADEATYSAAIASSTFVLALSTD